MNNNAQHLRLIRPAQAVHQQEVPAEAISMLAAHLWGHSLRVAASTSSQAVCPSNAEGMRILPICATISTQLVQEVALLSAPMPAGTHKSVPKGHLEVSLPSLHHDRQFEYS